MTTLVFRLRQVPDDEADDVRRLLDAASIDWYETSAGNWGIALPGIWVSEQAEAQRARELIDEYQNERVARVSGPIDSARFIEHLCARPLATAAIVLFCAFVLYVSISPFVRLVTLTRGS